MQKTLPSLEPRHGKGNGEKWGSGFSLDPMSKSCKQSESLATVGNNRGVAIIVQPQAGKHVTVVTLAGNGGDGQQHIRVHVDTGKRVQLSS